MSLTPSSFTAVLALLDALLDVALDKGPEIVAVGKIALRCLRNGDEPTPAELEQINQALLEAHGNLQDQLTLRLR